MFEQFEIFHLAILAAGRHLEYLKLLKDLRRVPSGLTQLPEIIERKTYPVRAIMRVKIRFGTLTTLLGLDIELETDTLAILCECLSVCWLGGWGVGGVVSSRIIINMFRIVVYKIVLSLIVSCRFV